MTSEDNIPPPVPLAQPKSALALPEEPPPMEMQSPPSNPYAGLSAAIKEPIGTPAGSESQK